VTWPTGSTPSASFGSAAATTTLPELYAAPEPTGAYGSGHRNVTLRPAEPGCLVLDVVDDAIMYAEVLYHSPRS